MIIMKKLTSLLIGCSLALAGAALAQQPVEEQSPSKGKRAPEKAHATQAQPEPNAAKAHAPAATQHEQHGAIKERGKPNERGATNQPHAEKSQKTQAGHEPAKAPETNVPGKSTDETTNEPGAGKGRKNREHEESGNAPATGTDVGHAAGTPTQKGKERQVQERKQGQGVNQPATEAGATSATSAAGQQNAQAKAGPRRRSLIRSRCSRLNRSTRTFVRNRSRSRFRRLLTIRIIGLKEVIAGRVSIIKYSARIIRNGTMRAGIDRVITVWS